MTLGHKIHSCFQIPALYFEHLLSTNLTMKVFQLFTLAALAGYAAADIVIENDIFNPDDIFDFVSSDDSQEFWKSPNTKKYYCTYRNLWTKIDHPTDYPQFARLSSYIMYSSTSGFLPWLTSRATTVGVETLAEVSSSFRSSSPSNQSPARSEYTTHPASCPLTLVFLVHLTSCFHR
jgi:hypothetical protein